jgi:hypothetical protein
MTMTTTARATRSRRPYRLGIDAHTEFVAMLVSELDAALDRSADDVRRLIRLLDIIDGPGEERYLEPRRLSDVLCQAAESLELDVAVRGTPGTDRFLCDPQSILLGAELVLSAFAGDGGPVQLGFPAAGIAHVEGALDLTDERRVWQLRCGRRVLEGENCRVRLVRVVGGYRLEIRVIES